MTENTGGFFSRWSQRKQAVKLGLAEDDKAPETIQKPLQSGTAPLATVQQKQSRARQVANIGRRRATHTAVRFFIFHDPRRYT